MGKIGYSHTKEARLKMRLARLGKVSPTKGMKWSSESKSRLSNSTKGKKKGPMSEEHKKNISIKLKGRFKGKEHPRWTGYTTIEKRIRISIEYKLWRSAVFARDNWTCQDCRDRGGILNAHHIKSFAKNPEIRTAIDNGITLCKKCHKKKHKKYG